jgi:hypothetical protein
MGGACYGPRSEERDDERHRGTLLDSASADERRELCDEYTELSEDLVLVQVQEVVPGGPDLIVTIDYASGDVHEVSRATFERDASHPALEEMSSDACFVMVAGFDLDGDRDEACGMIETSGDVREVCDDVQSYADNEMGGEEISDAPHCACAGAIHDSWSMRLCLAGSDDEGLTCVEVGRDAAGISAQEGDDGAQAEDSGR